jgi:hypothetical protein
MDRVVRACLRADDPGRRPYGLADSQCGDYTGVVRGPEWWRPLEHCDAHGLGTDRSDRASREDEVDA